MPRDCSPACSTRRHGLNYHDRVLGSDRFLYGATTNSRPLRCSSAIPEVVS